MLGLFPKVLMATGVVVAVALGLKLLAWLLGAVIGFLGFMLFTAIPVALAIWLIVKILQQLGKPSPAHGGE